MHGSFWFVKIPRVEQSAKPMRTVKGRLEPIKSAFFEVPATELARRLLGTHLVHDAPDGSRRTGRIVEVEAYEGPGDPACHARFGLTKRTRTLYGPPGHAYVYLIYGMYELFNVTAWHVGAGHAVLVRSIEPLWAAPVRTDGPGRLTRALGIDRSHDGQLLLRGALRLEAGDRPVGDVVVGPRVGVAYAGAAADLPWRFYEGGNRHVSRPSPSQIGQRKAAEATTTTSVGTPAERVTRVPRRTQ